MSQDYELVGRRREDFVWNLPKLLRPAEARRTVSLRLAGRPPTAPAAR